MEKFKLTITKNLKKRTTNIIIKNNDIEDFDNKIDYILHHGFKKMYRHNGFVTRDSGDICSYYKTFKKYDKICQSYVGQFNYKIEYIT